MAEPSGPVSIDPAAVVEAADSVRSDGDAIGLTSGPVPVTVIELAASTERLAGRYPSGPMGLQAMLAGFERARSGHDEKVAATFRAVSDHLALIALDATRADNADYLPLPKAGY